MRSAMTRIFTTLLFALCAWSAHAQPQQVLDIPTRPGVTLRMLTLEPAAPSSVVILIAGGGGQVDIASNGYIRREGNFLVRSRSLFAQRNLAVLVLDTPTDHRSPPYLGGQFRASPEHAADLGAAIAWAHARYGKKVWVVGTSRGTHSAATAAMQLQGDRAPDGIVLTSTVLRSLPGENAPPPLTELDLTGLAMPVLVVHHEQDPCGACSPALLPELMKHLPAGTPLHTVTGGKTYGAPCDAFSYHGFNGIEDRVVEDISAFIGSHP